jgi:nitrite reductase/ring-hydroxylating ferredoxin subunit
LAVTIARDHLSCGQVLQHLHGVTARQSARLRRLGPVADIPEGGTLAFEPSPGAFTGLFAYRRGETVRVYVNSCPHIGVSLDWAPGKFLSSDGARVVCSTHGAEFVPDDGLCVAGPCIGARLEAVMIHIKDGVLFVSEDAGG